MRKTDHVEAITILGCPQPQILNYDFVVTRPDHSFSLIDVAGSLNSESVMSEILAHRETD